MIIPWASKVLFKRGNDSTTLNTELFFDAPRNFDTAVIAVLIDCAVFTGLED